MRLDPELADRLSLQLVQEIAGAVPPGVGSDLRVWTATDRPTRDYLRVLERGSVDQVWQAYESVLSAWKRAGVRFARNIEIST